MINVIPFHRLNGIGLHYISFVFDGPSVPPFFQWIEEVLQGRSNEIGNLNTYRYVKKSKDWLRGPTFQVTMRDHATYPSTFLTYL